MSHGPLPAAVYWRRRLLIVAVLIALVWLIFMAVNSSDDASTRAPATSTPRATTAAVPVDGPLDVALAGNDQACDPQQVRISPTVASGQLTRGAVKIGLVVSTTETAACTLQPDDAALIAVISANDTPVWDSTLCRASLLPDPVQLSPDWSTLVATSWTGRVSGGGCASSEPFASQGRYTIQVGTLGGEPGEASFVLDARPKAVPKATKSTPKATKSTPKATKSTPKATKPTKATPSKATPSKATPSPSRTP